MGKKIAPCEECLVFPACKGRYRRKPKYWMDNKFGSELYEIAYDERCTKLIAHLKYSSQRERNKLKTLFGMELF